MTAKELIEELQKLPSDTPVGTEYISRGEISIGDVDQIVVEERYWPTGDEKEHKKQLVVYLESAYGFSNKLYGRESINEGRDPKIIELVCPKCGLTAITDEDDRDPCEGCGFDFHAEDGVER